jgi:hypothetical protein
MGNVINADMERLMKCPRSCEKDGLLDGAVW